MGEQRMMKTICVLFVIAAVACATPTDKDVKTLADSDAAATGFTLATGDYKMKGGKSGKWCRSTGNGSSNTVKCDQNNYSSTWSDGMKWKVFRWNAQQKNVFRNHRNIHKRCEDQGTKWRCNEKTSAGSTEKFTVQSLGNNQYALKGGKDNKYCADEDNTIRCNRNAIGQWEKFTIESIRM